MEKATVADETEASTWLVFILIAAACLRFYRIGGQSLWVDEIMTLAVSDPKPGYSIWDYLKYNIHGPLHSFIVYVFHFVSLSDAWLRVPSALAGVGGVYAFYLWVEEWIGRKTATVGAALLAINPMHVFYSQELRNYSFLFFFGVLSCLYFHKLIKEPNRRNYIIYGIVMALSALSNFSAAFLFIAHSAIFFLHFRPRLDSVLRWSSVTLLILVLIAPWVYRIWVVIDFSKLFTPVLPGEIEVTERLRGETTVTMTAVPYAFYVFSVGFTLGPSLRALHHEPALGFVFRNFFPSVSLSALCFGWLFVAGCFRFWQDRMLSKEAALYITLPIVLTIILCWQNAKAFNARYVILSLPAYICVLSGGLLAQRRFLGWAFTGAVAVLSLFSLGNYYFNGAYAKEDIRGAARYLEGSTRGDECIFVPTVTGVFRHYYRGDQPVYSLFAPLGTPRRKVDEQLEKLFSGCEAFWYVRARPWVDDPEGYLMQAIRKSYDSDYSVELNGVELVRFAKKRHPEP